MVEGTDLKVVVATHKKFDMPSDEVYCPVLVGATLQSEDEKALCKDYLFDDEGDNISALNKSFCELTGLYYAWKNVDAEYLGIVHYRRYFAERFIMKGSVEQAISGEKLAKLLEKYKIIVPRKQRYFIETMYSHYSHTHYAIHLDKTREIINELSPEYIKFFDIVMNQRSAYMFNMAIMSKELFDSYCSWLFPILYKLQEDMTLPELSGFHGRYYGRVAEIIFNVWLLYQISIGVVSKEEIKELPIMYIGKVNWARKIIAFLKAKFLHEKYRGSF